jgi:hypothetical protein
MKIRAVYMDGMDLGGTMGFRFYTIKFKDKIGLGSNSIFIYFELKLV